MSDRRDSARPHEKHFFEGFAKRSIEATLGVNVDHNTTTEEGVPDLKFYDGTREVAVEVKQILYPPPSRQLADPPLRKARELAYRHGHVPDDRLAPRVVCLPAPRS